MKKMLRTRRGIGAALALLVAVMLCANLAVTAGSAETKKRTVRISYGYNDYLKVSEDGYVSGHYARYLTELARLNDWEYEYVRTTWPEAVEMLSRGEIDLMFPMNYSEQREEFLDYSTLPIGYNVMAIFALSGSSYRYGEYDQFEGARITVAPESPNQTGLEDFAREWGFHYEPVYRDSSEELIEALRTGAADLAVTGAANEFPDGIVVAMMDADPVYFTVREGNGKLLEELNRGMQKLLKEETDLAADTFQKSLSGENSINVGFTREEQELIDSGKEVVVGFYEENEPLSYVQKDGSYDGIFIRLLEKINQFAELNLVLRPIPKDADWRSLVQKGEIDFYVGASSVILSEKEALRTTNSFMSYTNVLVTRTDCQLNVIDTPVIALTYGRVAWAQHLERYFEREIQVQLYSTYKDCLMAVAQGNADATLINNMELNYHSKNGRLSSLIQWPQFHFATDLYLVASDKVDEVTFSTVNKMVASLNQDYVNSTINDCLNIPYHSFSTEDVIYNARVPLMAVGVLAVMISLVSGVTRVQRKRQDTIRQEAAEREQHQLQILSAMSYEYSFVYYVDLDDNISEMVSMEIGTAAKSPGGELRVQEYTAAVDKYIENFVLPEFREKMHSSMEPKAILSRFDTESQFVIRYRIAPNDRNQQFFEMHFVQVGPNPQGHRMMVLGIRCVDDTIREEQQQRQILQDALDGANRANAAKSEFFSRMSHDIRTPLNAIMGMTAIAQAHIDEPERVRNSLGKITGASRHLLSLINDVLDMSKIETGKLLLSEEDINLPELVWGMLDILRPQMQEHGQKFRANLQGIRHEDVIGDSLRIQQVLMNILGNAIKYTPDGGEISLRIREIPLNTHNAGCFEFVIKDNGIGMSQEFQKHIFESFSRAEDLRISKIQGTGLGMAITQNLVQMMNGTVRVESEEGKGSVFTVTLFLRLQEERNIELPELKGETVLVVDNDPDSCEAICLMLEEMGFRSESYTGEQEAVEAVRRSLEEEKPYFAAIVDWKMPGMDGMQTSVEMKRLTKNRLGVVIMSAFDWSEIEEDARNANVDDFLSKPVLQSALVRLFRRLAGSRNNSAPAAQMAQENFRGRRVLLVEDNPLNREIAREILEMTELTVEETENGQEAVDRITATPPGYYDLVLMDIQMPVMNGYEATRAIRALARPDVQHLPIVAMTANAFVEDIQAAKAAGMNEHLSKPIDFEKLNQILKQYLEKA